MAMYHCSVKTIGRSGGSNVVNSAAYRSGEKLHEQQLDKTFYYSGKAMDVMHKEIMAPEKSPEWVKDRERLWNEVERGEKRKDSQLAREVEISLPREFTVDQNIALAKEYVQREFVDKGMVVDLCMHYGMKGDSYNPHAHVLLTMRDIDENGFGKKNIGWNNRELLQEWRESWAELSNKHLALNGIEQQIDHRSLKEQGIDLVPQNVELPSDAKDRLTGQRERQLEIMRENGERLKENPEIALHAITNRQSTFTERDIARYVNSRTADKEQYDVVMEKIKGHEDLVKLTSEKGGDRYTTKEMLRVERQMYKGVANKSKDTSFGVKEGMVEKAATYYGLSNEQKAAMEYITQEKGISSIVGYAGTGKTHMLGAAREIWESSGYNVKGATLSGIAAEWLERGAGIDSRTVARRLIDWENGRDVLGTKDILVIDEAGMLGTKDVARIVGEVEAKGAKLVMIGDPQQLQAIEAGAAFRGIAERTGYLEMNDIKRQSSDWQREATKMFAMGEAGKALEEYEKKGDLHVYAKKEQAMDAMVNAWCDDKIDRGGTQIMLAYKREDVRKLNEIARGELKKCGILDKGQELDLSNGKREMSFGDQVYFLRNDNGLGVKNGTLGEIIGVSEKGDVRVNIKDEEKDREVAFNIDKYNYLDHGYASTVHKAQVITVDRAYVMASKGYNQHIGYVAMSRHIEGVSLYWSKDEFNNLNDLKNQMGREARKDNAMDYMESAKEYVKERGIETAYKDICVRNNKMYNAERLEDRLKERDNQRLVKDGVDENKYYHVIDRLERRMGFNKGVKELEKKYNYKVSKNLENGEILRYHAKEEINGAEYALLRVYGKREMKLMPVRDCKDLMPNNEAKIFKAPTGAMMAFPSQGELWNRKTESLREAFGKEVSFNMEVGDRGKYRGTIEFEGKRYGVMERYDQVKLIDIGNCAKELKDGNYMKIEASDYNKDKMMGVADTERQKEVQLEKEMNKQKQMDRGREFEMEM